MRTECVPVGPDFFTSAPWQFRASAEIGLSAAGVFALMEDASSWPKWFSGIQGVEWTTPRPFGVGTERIVRLGAVTVFEHFFVWEPASRLSFYLSAHEAPLPLFRALAEDYLLEPLGVDRCRFSYVVAIDPRLPLKLTGPLGRFNLGRSFKSVPSRLARYVEQNPPRP